MIGDEGVGPVHDVNGLVVVLLDRAPHLPVEEVPLAQRATLHQVSPEGPAQRRELQPIPRLTRRIRSEYLGNVRQ